LNGRDEVSLETVELMDNRLGPVACAALGESLMLGANRSLTSLKLDLNAGIGDEGVVALCKGLRTNRTLKKLSLGYCAVGVDGAEALAAVIASPLSGLEHLNLMGNHIGAEGCAIIARAAQVSKTLRELILRDNGIGGGTLITFVADRAGAVRRALSAAATAPAAGGAGGSSVFSYPVPPLPHSTSVGSAGFRAGGASAVAGGSSPTLLAPSVDPLSTMASVDAALSEAAASAPAHTKAALEELGKALKEPTVPLCHVNLELNALRADEARVLIPYVKDNPKVAVLLVDTTLPTEVFAELCKTGIVKVRVGWERGG